MASKKPMTVKYRRKRESKTNYRTRLRLLLSDKVRLVVRMSLNHITAQIIQFETKGDRVLVAAHSSELKKMGWNYYTSNTPAAYLVGYLLGKKALKKGVKDAIFDIGMRQAGKGSRIYSVLQGALDAGLAVPHSEEVLPLKTRVRGEHIAAFAKLAKERPECKNQFSKSKADLALMPKAFDDLKNKINSI